MWAMRSLRGSARWCKSCRECWTLVQCDYVGDNIGCWAIGEVMVVIERWWTSRTPERWTRWERWSPRSGGKLKVLNLEFVFVLAAEIIQVLN